MFSSLESKDVEASGTANIPQDGDITAPNAPIVTPIKDKDRYIKGFAEPNATILIMDKDGNNVKGKVKPDGTFKIKVNDTFKDSKKVKIIAYDHNENTSPFKVVKVKDTTSDKSAETTTKTPDNHVSTTTSEQPSSESTSIQTPTITNTTEIPSVAIPPVNNTTEAPSIVIPPVNNTTEIPSIVIPPVSNTTETPTTEIPGGGSMTKMPTTEIPKPSIPDPCITDGGLHSLRTGMRERYSINDSTTSQTTSVTSIDASNLSIGDHVWWDENWNNMFDANEKPVAGLEVSLRDYSGNEVGRTVTDTQGNYKFEGLENGTYILNFHNPLTWSPLIANIEADLHDINDSGGPIDIIVNLKDNNLNIDQGYYYTGLTSADCIPTTEETPSTEVTTTEAPTTETPGLYSIGDYTWYDDDNDNVQDPEEAPFTNVVVYLYDVNYNLIATTTTDANGNYIFNDIAPGDYTVMFETPNGTRPSNPDDIYVTITDSDVLTADKGFYTPPINCTLSYNNDYLAGLLADNLVPGSILSYLLDGKVFTNTVDETGFVWVDIYELRTEPRTEGIVRLESPDGTIVEYPDTICARELKIRE
ncbi:hypothetical protein BFS35_010690 [Macrococcoides goetzii]|uniref:SD-repeat containing protein B domain-containing protein n=1 Tax=Macrococcoides goetzii TaxID=1891097 RepID=A0A395G8F4_9STAP|nr:SdrD B-like domain-containing protein [Macrococcus goetzii]RAI79913.1 hypothetical protein BFS35_010690 [Macrococcus goetzii]